MCYQNHLGNGLLQIHEAVSSPYQHTIHGGLQEQNYIVKSFTSSVLMEGQRCEKDGIAHQLA